MASVQCVSAVLKCATVTLLLPSTALHKVIQGGIMDESREKAVTLLVCLAGICVRVCVCVCVCERMYIHTYMYIYTHTHTHIHTYIHTYVYVYVYVCVCVCVCVYSS